MIDTDGEWMQISPNTRVLTKPSEANKAERAAIPTPKKPINIVDILKKKGVITDADLQAVE